MNNFKELGLSAELVETLNRLGIEKPTPIQSKAIPQILANPGGDFIGLAQTGTGKTAAFGLPLIETVDTSERHIQALILAPTRELSQQIWKQLEDSYIFS